MTTPKSVIERKMSVYWLTMLLLNGINVYPGHNKREVVKWIAAVYPWLICSFWAFITTSVFTSLVSQNTSYEDTIEMLTYITGSSSTLALFAIGVYKRSELNKMMDIVRCEFWHDGGRPAADELFRQFACTYGYVMPVANLMMCMTPIVWAINHGDIGSPASLIFRMWTPWTFITPAKYAVVYAIQFVVSLSVLTSIVGMVNAMVLIVNEMQVQVDMLIDTIRNLHVDNIYNPTTLDLFDQKNFGISQTRSTTIHSLIECVKHHQKLIEYFNYFKSYFNLLFLVDILYIMVMTCLCASSVLLVDGFSAFHIKMLSLLIIVECQFLLYCFIGEKFSLMNKQLGDCVYFKLIKCKDLKLARMGFLIILRTQRSLKLSAMGIQNYSASLFTFTVTMRSAYAGLNVLYNWSQNTNKS